MTGRGDGGEAGGARMSRSFFDAVERDLVHAAAKRARSPRRRFAAFALTGTLVLGVAGTAAGGTYLALRSSSIAPFAASDFTPEQRVAPGTSLVLAPRAADPAPSTPPWAVRISRSSTGLVCTTAGQVKAGEFGLVGLDGTFRAVPEANADACGSGVLLGTRVFAAEDRRDVRTVVNGYAGDGVTRVTIAVGDGKPRPVQLSPEGGFGARAARLPRGQRARGHAPLRRGRAALRIRGRGWVHGRRPRGRSGVADHGHHLQHR